MTMTIDDYINRVLAALPQATPERSQIALELRGHIAERLESGATEAEVIRQLGDPLTLAESYLSAVPLVAASFGARVVAKLIDLAIVGIFMAALVGLVLQFGSIGGWLPPGFAFPVAMLIGLVGGSFVFGLYTVASEASAGETLGKRAMGMRVVRESGAQISVGQAIVRQLPIFSQVYWIDVLFALFTEKSQRAFELLSKTRVVRAKPLEAR
jgi:uncharacterized RDD family membrane protein YckC